MTIKQTHQTGRGIGLVMAIAIDIALAVFVGKHFHSGFVGCTAYFILGRFTAIQDNTNEIKRKLG